MWIRPALCTAASRCWCAAAVPTGSKVRHETLANLSKLPTGVIAAVEATLKGLAGDQRLAVCTITRSLPHGHVLAAMAPALGLPAGSAGWSCDLALG